MASLFYPDLTAAGERAIGHRWQCLVASIVILASAAVLRICGAINDLWLDEIWSLHIAGDLSAPIDVFTKIHHDNNHYLNTLYMFLVGSHGNWPGYRIPSILAGIGTVAVAGLIGGRRNAPSALFAMLLVGFSYLAVLYSSEARGYMTSVFFSLLSFYLLDRYLETKRLPFALMFSVSAVLGLLAHLVFLSFFAAAVVWSGYRLIKSQAEPKQIALVALLCHAMPSLFIAVLYFVDVRHMVTGGGTPSTLLHAYMAALAWGLGTPSEDFNLVWGCMALVILAVGLRMLWKEKSDLLVFFLGAILVFPILLAFFSGSSSFYARFFILAVVFLLILFSFVLADFYRRGSPGMVISALLLTAYLAGNSWHMVSLFAYGRGQYGDAIRLMAKQSNGPLVTIGGDHDFRIGTVMEFHEPKELALKNFRYDHQGSWQRGGPEWIICHKESYEAPVPPAAQLQDNTGITYDFVTTFPATPLSGLHWFLYHRHQ